MSEVYAIADGSDFPLWEMPRGGDGSASFGEYQRGWGAGYSRYGVLSGCMTGQLCTWLRNGLQLFASALQERIPHGSNVCFFSEG